MNVKIKPLLIGDYQSVIELWQNTEGISLSETDEYQQMQLFLNRNPGLSSMALLEMELIGAILCSHDGRRGYLHHLAVKEAYRNQGIGSSLVQKSIGLLKKEGIIKCNIFFLDDNIEGMKFWEGNGFKLLPHYGWMQMPI